jgi:hypothetical protein
VRKATQAGRDYFPVALAAAFFALNLWSALNHAMWRDEWAAWLSARGSASFTDLIAAIRYTGRGWFGWFGFAWVVKHLGYDPWLLKICHVLISTATVYLFARCSPFTRLQVGLFAFGYFPFYEYGTILRDYGYTLFLATVGCILLISPRRRPLAFGVTLALLFQSHPFGLILGCALGATYLFDLWRTRSDPARACPRRQLFAGLGLAGASLVAGVIMMNPPAEMFGMIFGQGQQNVPLGTRFLRSLPFPWRAWFPVPAFGGWNSNIFDSWPWLQTSLWLAVFFFAVAAFWRRPTALFFLCVGMLGVGAALCHMPWMPVRYHGTYFVVLILGFWMALSPPDAAEDQPPATGFLDRVRQYQQPFLVVLLAIHVVPAVVFTAQERLVPFSGSREAVEIIKRNAPADVPVVADPDYTAACISGYLNRPVYIASRREFTTYTIVDAKRKTYAVGAGELLNAAYELMAAEKRDVIGVTSYRAAFPPGTVDQLGVARSTVDEEYYVFRIRYPGR